MSGDVRLVPAMIPSPTIPAGPWTVAPWSWTESSRASDPDEQSCSRACSRWRLSRRHQILKWWKPQTGAPAGAFKLRLSSLYLFEILILSSRRIICCIRIAVCTWTHFQCFHIHSSVRKQKDSATQVPSITMTVHILCDWKYAYYSHTEYRVTQLTSLHNSIYIYIYICVWYL